MKPWKKICSVLAFTILGCLIFNYSTERIHLYSNTRYVKTQILKQIPVKSSILSAQDVLRKDGFKCEMVFNEGFQENEGMETISDSKNMDFLYCHKESFSIFVCTETWQIAIVNRNNSVDNVLVSRGTNCF